MRVIYLHGFASGPRSTKAVALKERLDRDGIPCLVPDLNVPDFEHLRVSEAVRNVSALVDGPTVLAGSSLGGLIALHVAGRSEDVKRLVLLCPALAASERWTEMLGAAALERWKRDGTLEFWNFVTNTERKVDFGFFADLMSLAHPPAPRVPIRLIHGRDDETVPVALSEEFARDNPGLVTLDVVDDDHSLLKHVDLVHQAIVEAVRKG